MEDLVYNEYNVSDIHIAHNQFGLESFDESDLNNLSWMPNNLIKTVEFHRGFKDFDFGNPSKYYLYTGRGPSVGSFHIGHLLGLEFILEFQAYVKNKIYFMISDDEKIFRDKITNDEMKSNVTNTIVQLNKIGFNSSNTNINVNSHGLSSEQYQLVIKLMSLTTLNKLEHIFGKKDNVGEYFYVFVQMMPCFIEKDKQCIIIAGKDQDPFFRLARDLAKRIGCPSPIIIYTKNVPGLDGSEKMSSSIVASNPIFMSDSEIIIKSKVSSIKKVGAGTLDELFNSGCNLELDIPFKLIELFDKNELNVKLIKKYYEKAQLVSDTDIELIKSLVSDKGFKIRGVMIVITTFGVRTYLTNLLVNLVNNY
jgi:tryptophanyl-tRNA synthetase